MVSKAARLLVGFLILFSVWHTALAFGEEARKPEIILTPPPLPIIQRGIYKNDYICLYPFAAGQLDAAMRRYESRLTKALAKAWPGTLENSPTLLATVAQNGRLTQLQLLTSSGSIPQDKAVIQSIIQAFPTERLPEVLVSTSFLLHKQTFLPRHQYSAQEQSHNQQLFSNLNAAIRKQWTAMKPISDKPYKVAAKIWIDTETGQIMSIVPPLVCDQEDLKAQFIEALRKIAQIEMPSSHHSAKLLDLTLSIKGNKVLFYPPDSSDWTE